MSAAQIAVTVYAALSLAACTTAVILGGRRYRKSVEGNER